MTVAVRHAATGAPVPNAELVIRPLTATDPGTGRPLKPIAQLGAAIKGSDAQVVVTDASVQATTNADGVAAVPAPTRGPFEIVLRIPFDPIRRLVIDARDHPYASDTVGPWRVLPTVEAPPGDEELGAIEFQLRTAGSTD